MKDFMDEDFLLCSESAKTLYHTYAEKMPIFDFHCHISPEEIAADKRYENITQLWLYGDHYKWRAMRANGIDEKYITGDAGDYEKFQKWAETLPNCIGNPLYHWSHLELKRYFNINKPLCPETAHEIYEACNKIITGGDFTTRRIIEKSNVRIICTTDTPVDTLEHHRAISEDTYFNVKVLPTFRPDIFLRVEKPEFSNWVSKLSEVSGIKINSLADFVKALKQRIEFFHTIGCRISDQVLEPVVFEPANEAEAEAVFKNAMSGKELTATQAAVFKTWLLCVLAKEYRRLGWAMQYHIGTMRNVNSRMYKMLGADTGFDAVGDTSSAAAVAGLLDFFEKSDALPKTILYCLNPNDMEMLFTIGSCFARGGEPGKVQLGAAWWYNDQKDGIIRQLKTLAGLGLLGRFVGMLTDSRSFISYPRHEYFRRILCNLLGDWMENGEIPADFKMIGTMVQNICYNNAIQYFGVL